MNLYPYQQRSVKAVERFGGRSLVALDMGLGKTPIACIYLVRNPSALPAVVVCPAIAKYVWEDEAAKWTDLQTQTIHGTAPARVGSRPITIINYDILKDHVGSLKAIRPRTIVLDECQYIKNHKATRSKDTGKLHYKVARVGAARRLCHGVPYVLALSGTPFENCPAELWNVLNILRPDKFPSFYAYGHRYCGARRGFGGHWEFKGSSNVAELHEKLTRHLMIRYRKADVLTDLPPKTRQTVPCELSDREQYDRAENDFLRWMAEHHADRLDRALRAEAMVKVGYLLRLAARLKLRAVVRWVNDFLTGSDEKLVLFATHRKMIAALERRCRARSVSVVGGMSSPARKAAVRQFQKDPKTRLFFGNTKAAGTAITLTAASTVAVAELDWVPARLVQAEDRVYRIGQTKPAWVYYLVARGTKEERLCRIIMEKQATLSDVLDGGEGADDFDLLKLLLKEN